MDAVRGVQAEAIEVKLVDPIGGIGQEEFADRPGVGAVEVDCSSPVGLVAISKVVFRERIETLAGRPR